MGKIANILKKSFMIITPAGTLKNIYDRNAKKNQKVLEITKSRFGIDPNQKEMSFSFWMEHHKFTGKDLEKSYTVYAVSAYIALFVFLTTLFLTAVNLYDRGLNIMMFSYFTTDAVFFTVWWSFLYKCKILRDFSFPKNKWRLFSSLNETLPDVKLPLEKKFNKIYGKKHYRVIDAKAVKK